MFQIPVLFPNNDDDDDNSLIIRLEDTSSDAPNDIFQYNTHTDMCALKLNQRRQTQNRQTKEFQLNRIIYIIRN